MERGALISLENDMKSIQKVLVAACFAIAANSVAYAGAVNPSIVVVNTGQAYGTLAAARSSSDTLEYIGCQTVATTTGLQLSCSAQNSSGVSTYCNSTNQYMVNMAMGISQASYVSFQWDSSHNCTSVVVSNSSLYLP